MNRLPNILTMSRIAVIPALIALIWIGTPTLRWIALTIYAIACITDILDGYLARSLNQQSALGRLFDPIADKLLIAVAIVMLVAFDRVTGLAVLPALVILCREILVSGLREFLAEIRISVPVSYLAKWKTAVQMLAIGLLLLGDVMPSLPLGEIGTFGIWAAAMFTLITGFDYFQHGLRHLLEAPATPTVAPDKGMRDAKEASRKSTPEA